MFQRRHYQTIAAALNEHVKSGEGNKEETRKVAARLAWRFHVDNPINFNIAKFMDACGFEEFNEEAR